MVENGGLGGLPLVLLGLALVAYVLARGVEPPRHLDALVVCACGFCLMRAPGDQLSAVGPRLVISALVLFVGSLGVVACRRPASARRVLMAATVVWALIGSLVIVESPKPTIDVFLLEQGGSSALVQGQNPYAVLYPNPYTPEDTVRYFGDNRSHLQEYPYPPLSLAVTTIGYVLGGDVRWSLLAFALAIPWLLYALARHAGHAENVAAGLAFLDLVHPRRTFILEQAWTDGLIAGAFLFLVFVLFVARKRASLLGGAALGIFLATKQYSVLVLPLLWPRRVMPRVWWAVGLGVAFLVTIPALGWGARDFINDVILFQLRQPARADAMSVPGLVQWTTGIRLPGFVAVAAAGGALTWCVRKGIDTHRLALAAACVYGVFFASAKQAFCNYYYFLSVVVLAAAATTPAGVPRPTTAAG